MALLNTRRRGGRGERGGKTIGNGMLSLATSLRGLFIMAILMLGAIQLIGRDNRSSSPPVAVASEAAVEINQALRGADRFEEIKGFTAVDYEQYLLGPAGSKHYILLHYLATHYADEPTCPER
ncbi:hypothetical protein ACHAXH_006419 [Discostella pseudostelligera]